MYKSKEEARRKSKEWYYANRERVLAERKNPEYQKRKAINQRLWRENNKERYAEYQKEYNKKNKDVQRYKRFQFKMAALKEYGGDPPRCSCCGESKIGFLTIDHMNNDGKHQRKGITQVYYKWLKNNNYPKDLNLAVTCYNCNYGRAKQGGTCPHIKEFYR